MAYTNNAMLIRRELIARVTRMLFEGKLVEEIDRIPLVMRPKHSREISRCCVYKDRAMIRYKLMALLGYNISDEEDELTPLSDYAIQAMKRPELTKKVITVVDGACTSCVRVNYVVTNICKGCVGRPCMLNCPKDAISFSRGQAEIHHDECANCGLCMKACPFHAIIFVPVPCEEACPVNAIHKDNEGVTMIDENKCIHCGKCMTACPFGAIMVKSHIIEIHKALVSEKRVVAMVAPAILGQFKAGFGKVVSAIKALGFDEVVEVAIGANMTVDHESAEFVERMKNNEPFMTSSCCPAYTDMVEKHLPELSSYVSDTPTPMFYTAQLAKDKDPDCITVFFGPCIAKRYEAMKNPLVDYVVNFEEMESMFAGAGIQVDKMETCDWDHSIDSMGRGFATSGGVSAAIRAKLGPTCDLKEIMIDGISKNEIKTLKGFIKGECPGNFVEVMSCEGGCVAGPGTINNPKAAARLVKDFCKKN